MTICDSSSNPNRRSHLLPLLLTVAWATNTFSCAPDGENTNWPIREANDQRLVKVLIMNQHDNLSQTLFVFGLIKQVQLTLLHCLIVFGFSRYSPLTILTGSERGDRVSARSGVNTQIFTAEKMPSN